MWSGAAWLLVLLCLWRPGLAPPSCAKTPHFAHRGRVLMPCVCKTTPFCSRRLGFDALRMQNHPFLLTAPRPRRRPCSAEEIIFPDGAGKTNFPAPHLLRHPTPRRPFPTAPALLPISSVKCKMLKHNLLRKRGVSVFNTPLLYNPFRISALHFTPRRPRSALPSSPLAPVAFFPRRPPTLLR